MVLLEDWRNFFFASDRVVTNYMASCDIGISAKGTLFNLVSAAGGASGHISVNAAFNSSLVFGTGRTFGGTISPFGQKDQWQKWEKSVFERPAIVDVQTANLSSLIAQWNQSCSDQFHLAEKNHRIRAYLRQQLIPIIQGIQFYLNLEKWPTCLFGPQKSSCNPLLILAKAKTLENKISETLSQKPITTELQAFAFTAELTNVIFHLPKPPPKVNIRRWGSTHSGEISFAAFCGISEMQIGFNTDVGNQAISIQPGADAASGGYLAWHYSAGSNYGIGTSACVTYRVAKDMGPKATVFNLAHVGKKQLGKFWLCAITETQAGFNSKIGDSYMQILKNSDGTWTYTASNHYPDIASVACLVSPLPGLPDTVNIYPIVPNNKDIGFGPISKDLGPHFLCMLSGVKYGHNSDIGNQYASLRKDSKSGHWIYMNTQGESGGVVCIA